MKNLLLLLVLIYTSTAFAQTPTTNPGTIESPKKFSLGILGGGNLNFMPFSPNKRRFEGGGTYNSNIRPEFAYFGGLSARQELNQRFALKMDVQYVVKGYGFKPGFNNQERYQASSIDFVPQVEYQLYKNLFVSLGGYGGIHLKERVKFVDQNWTELDEDFIQFAEKSNWGLVSGLRLEFNRVSFLMKYQHGLTPAIKWEIHDEVGQSLAAKQQHRSLQFGLAFNIL